MRTAITYFMLWIFRLPVTVLLLVYLVISYSWISVAYSSKRKDELINSAYDNVQNFFTSFALEASLFCFAFWIILSHIIF